MTYQRFKQLWDVLITNRPKANKLLSNCENGMTENTKIALIEYGHGNTEKFDKVRELLKK
jgi:hypothetical protein